MNTRRCRPKGWIALVCLTAVLLSACVPGSWQVFPVVKRSEGPPSVMRLSHYLPVPFYEPVGSLSPAITYFSREVKRATGGKVIVEMFPNSQLMLPEDQLDAVSSGRIEAALIPQPLVGRAVPSIEALSSLLVFRGWEGLERAVSDPNLAQALDEQLATRNLALVQWNGDGWSWFASTGQAIIRPDDLKGRVVGVNDGTGRALVEVSGGTAVSLPSGPAYPGAVRNAAHNGIINAALVSSSEFVGAQMWEEFQFYPRAKALLSSWMIVVNREYWDSLTDTNRLIVKQAAAKFLGTDWLRYGLAVEDANFNALRTKASVPAYDLNEGDLRMWAALTDRMDVSPGANTDENAVAFLRASVNAAGSVTRN